MTWLIYPATAAVFLLGVVTGHRVAGEEGHADAYLAGHRDGFKEGLLRGIQQGRKEAQN